MTEMLLKTICGSKAHGLDTPASDTDYHGVFVVPTAEILALGQRTLQTSWQEGTEDDVSWEIGHFLNLATHCNPTILETFRAPVTQITPEGIELRCLFDFIWEPTRVRDAFVGYGLNQRKKFLDSHEDAARLPKYAVAYLRTLYMAEHLLLTGNLVVDMTSTPVFDRLKTWKSWNPTDVNFGEVISVTKAYERRVNDAYDWHMRYVTQKPDLDKINAFLLKVRKEHWN